MKVLAHSQCPYSPSLAKQQISDEVLKQTLMTEVGQVCCGGASLWGSSTLASELH